MITYERAPDGGLVAVAEVVVGIDHRRFRLPIGRWDGEPPVAGLAGAPVVVCPDPAMANLARTGILRSGASPDIATLSAGAGLPNDLLIAVQQGAEAVVVRSGSKEEMLATRILNGRALPALPLGDPIALRTLFEASEVDVNVAVPAAEGTLRSAIREALAPLGLDTLHHLVEVDPRPAFEEAGRDIAGASLNELGAGAAGVLAGRLAAANRRWHDDVREG